ncbi:MAG: hypothetical protein Q8P41_28810 [Pseudomonadota bacterium]|nr:hypothetical protein [Pseudomonadota bacterium]
MTGGQRRTLAALVRTLLPSERPLEIDGTGAGVAGSIEDWLRLIPAPQRTAFLATLTAFDTGFGVWCGRSVSFADGTSAERRAWIDAVSEAPAWPARKVFEALRFVLLLHYAERPAVLDALDPSGALGSN